MLYLCTIGVDRTMSELFTSTKARQRWLRFDLREPHSISTGLTRSQARIITDDARNSIAACSRCSVGSRVSLATSMCAEKIDLLLAQWISALIGTRTTAAGGLDKGDSRLSLVIASFTLIFFPRRNCMDCKPHVSTSALATLSLGFLPRPYTLIMPHLQNQSHFCASSRCR